MRRFPGAPPAPPPQPPTHPSPPWTTGALPARGTENSTAQTIQSLLIGDFCTGHGFGPSEPPVPSPSPMPLPSDVPGEAVNGAKRSRRGVRL